MSQIASFPALFTLHGDDVSLEFTHEREVKEVVVPEARETVPDEFTSGDIVWVRVRSGGQIIIEAFTPEAFG